MHLPVLLMGLAHQFAWQANHRGLKLQNRLCNVRIDAVMAFILTYLSKFRMIV
jgi:hypothetical protein